MISFLKVLERSSFCPILKKPKAIVQGFFFAVRKKVLRKLNRFKVLEKRN